MTSRGNTPKFYLDEDDREEGVDRSVRPELRARKSLGVVRGGRSGFMKKQARSGRGPSWKSWLFLFLLFGLVFFAMVAGYAFYETRDLPSALAVRQIHLPQITRVFDRKGRPLGRIFVERRTVLPMSDIPRVMVLSVLAAEDADFYVHKGLDYPGIGRALLRAILRPGASHQGASTITQQVVKNLLLSPERTLSRKLRELVLARRLEQELTKNEILNLYLNVINFGHGRYGVEEASRYYFAKSAKDLNLAEAALLAGIPKSPQRLSPRTHYDDAMARQHFVLSQLADKRAEYWPDLTLEAIAVARSVPIKLASIQDGDDPAPEITSWVREYLTKLVGAENVRRGGYQVQTTLDSELELAARMALRRGLERIDQRLGVQVTEKTPRPDAKKTQPRLSGAPQLSPRAKNSAQLKVGRTYNAVITNVSDAGQVDLSVEGHSAHALFSSLSRYNPKRLSPGQWWAVARTWTNPVRASVDAIEEDGTPRMRLELGPEGSVVVIDPLSRELLVAVGGYEAGYGFNRALQAVRQPGSAFKPILYALAIQSRKYTPATLVLDAPEVFGNWKPHNAETSNYQGLIRLRQALAQSVNMVAIRVIQEVTPQGVAEFAKTMGIESPLDPTLALALGASEVTSLELTNAYATIAAGGQYRPVHIVERVTDARGHDVALPQDPLPAQPLSPAEAYVVTSLMTSVVKEGTGAGAQQLGRPVAGKTGTSNDARDVWFVGFTPRYVAGVWVGFDDHRSLGHRESGSRGAVPIWVDTMKAVEKGKPQIDFAAHPSVVTVKIDPASGLLAYPGQANAIDEVFLEGTAPTEVARPADVADPSTYMMEQVEPENPSPSAVTPAAPPATQSAPQ